jgi:hypothetical protein
MLDGFPFPADCQKTIEAACYARTHGDERWGRFDLFALFAGIAGLLIFCGLSLISNNEPGGHYGLVQRLALAAGGLWVLILCLGLLVVRKRPDSERAARPPGALPE